MCCHGLVLRALATGSQLRVFFVQFSLVCVGLLVKLAVVKGVVQLVSTFLKRFLHNMVALNSQGRLTERTKIKSHYYCPSNHYYLGGGTLSRSYYLAIATTIARGPLQSG